MHICNQIHSILSNCGCWCVWLAGLSWSHFQTNVLKMKLFKTFFFFKFSVSKELLHWGSMCCYMGTKVSWLGMKQQTYLFHCWTVIFNIVLTWFIACLRKYIKILMKHCNAVFIHVLLLWCVTRLNFTVASIILMLTKIVIICL